MKKPAEIIAEFRKKLDSVPGKAEKVQEIADFAVVYGDCFGVQLIELIEQGIDISREIGDRSGETLCFCNLAFMNRVTGAKSLESKYSVSLPELTQKVETIKNDPESYAMGLNMLSYFHWFRGEYEKAFNLVFESFKVIDEKSSRGFGWNNFGLAVFYFDTKDFENSRIHYQRAFDTFEKIGLKYGRARAANGLASVAIAENKIQEALPLLEYSAKIYRDMSHYAGLSRAVNDLGLLEKTNGNFEKAVAHFKESIELRKEIDHLHGLITSYTELGETFLQLKDPTPALEYLKQGLDLALKVKTQQKESRLHKLMYDAYKNLNNTELALHHFEKYFEVKSQILSDEAATNIKKIQTRFEKEKSEKEAELERFKNVELKKANAIIEQKNKDITDSINYARRIQLGILPSKEILDKYFNDYFVLYKPKDIVSGDFYWAAELQDRKTGKHLSVIAAVDCTGHGVPGAFMSMLGHSLLNQTINHPEINQPADILNYLNKKLPENLKSSGVEQHIRDGMDMTLCMFDFKNHQVQFAGANNPCWIVRKGQIIEVKADKQAISASTDSDKRNFSNHLIQLEKNDNVYLFTDGFADQFGGPDEKKFSYKRLRELLLKIGNEKPEKQKALLDAAFEDWKGQHEQIDDVCVIGIRI